MARIGHLCRPRDKASRVALNFLGFPADHAPMLDRLIIMTATKAIGVSGRPSRQADRHGVRKVALTSIVLFSLTLGLFTLQSGSLPFYYATWLLVAIVGAGTLPITWTRAVNEVLDIRKGLALGITLAGSGISSLCLKPLTAALLAAYGWLAAFGFLALLPLLVSFPLAWFGQSSPTGKQNAFSRTLRSKRSPPATSRR